MPEAPALRPEKRLSGGVVVSQVIPSHAAVLHPPGRRIGVPDVDDLAAGAAVLGSGGGGDVRTAAAMARHQLATHGPLPLLPLSDLPAEALVACVGAVGSTTALSERLPGGDEFTTVLDTLSRQLPTPLTAVQPLQIGGVNALLAVVAAVRAGLPMVDADAMGRAFPRLDQTTLSAAGHPASPTAIADARGTALVVTTPDNHTLELLVRKALPALGGWCAIATHPGTAHAYAGAVVDHSVTRALALGADFRRAAAEPAHRAAFLRRWQGTPLRGGTVTEIRRAPTPSGTRTTITVQDHTDPARTLRLEAAEEYLLLLDDGRPLAVTPEIICALDPRTWNLAPPDRLTENQHISLFALPAASAWHPPPTDLVGLPSYHLRDLPEGAPCPRPPSAT
ncbi:DUF917 domain-containing protein [Streptomyces sp. NPDC018031]|uniref:DUF917 domain-containing protein n=1 Tax=Streptomyces sp. NPDC018031 TaxID=3365033 RepID=UPI0037B0D46C